MTMARPLPFVWPYSLIFWAVFVGAMVRESVIVRRARKAATSGSAPDDRGSLRAIMLTQSLGFFAVFFLAWRPYGRFADPRAAFWIGMLIYLAAAALRRWCFRALGQFFTGEVRVRPEQLVITTGPYRYVRHPSYTAGMMLVVGVAVALGTWLGTLIALALAAIGYGYRVRVEERALSEKIGTPYRDYAARTKRFIPFVI